ncbi:uncharacterized protein CFAP92 isoform X1 [Anomaloglossus baeobatrachus]|uniref:uncharacterized protein CFAP92 isoform X1 n=1 Tax=Anomaloglossus baeobatrachus TaxID=238106 RepID=UPI003F4F50F7
MMAAESEDYDSGVHTDNESRSQQRTLLSQKGGLSDYGTDCSSPEMGKVRSEKEAESQVTTDGLIQEAKEADDAPASNDLQEEPHGVTCTVTICLAIPSPPTKEENKSNADSKGKVLSKHPKNVIEAPKAQKYFHFEYFLLPEDTEATRVDVIMFGAVAKLYMEQETRLLKPWQENERTWLTWSHSVDISVTKDLLLKALKHEIRVKMWSTKDKVSAKARFDRPKAFRVSAVRDGEDPGVKQVLLNQRKLFEDRLPKQSVTFEKSGNTVYLEDCSAGDPSTLETLGPVEQSENSWSTITVGVQTSGERGVLLTDRKTSEKEKCKKALGIAPLQGERKYLMLSINFMPLLAGDLSVTSRLQERSPQILDCYVTLALNTSLLSDPQRRELNPLVIRVLSATCLPTSPTPVEVLQEKCHPVYCKYRFQDHPCHRTHGQAHGTHVYFRDVNVVFVGALSPGKLREFLLGPAVEIQVHDRDQKVQEDVSRPVLFGMEPEDEKLSNVGLVTSKSTIHNPFMKRDKLSDPYGTAKMQLSELLCGATYLNISIPIFNCESPDAKEYYSSSKNGGLVASVNDGQISPFPAGHYLEAQSRLKVRVDLAVPLSAAPGAPECPFGRIIYIFDYKNNELFQDLLLKITEINSRAFTLDPEPIKVSLDVLSRVGLKDDQKEDTSLDVITGVHLMDGDLHLFILEGLQQMAVKELWETVPSRAAEPQGRLEILYNSEMSFHERLYSDLGVLVCHVRLHGPLHSVVDRPLLYIRDMVPPLCFQALSRLDYVCRAKKLREVIQSDLLPTVEMIHLLSREFGVPLKPTDFFTAKGNTVNKEMVISEKTDKKFRRPVHVPLDNSNEAYAQVKREIENCKNKDHIKTNIDRVWQMSRQVRKPEVEYVEIVPVDGTSVHNYSSQALNSTELAHKRLRQKMAEEPNCRYSYCLDYQSATLSPVDVIEEMEKRAAKSREEWMTPSGFIYPGFRSSIESNLHPKKPDDARSQELTKAWKENILHTGTLRPTLDSRDRWRWAERHMDFDLYKKPYDRGSLLAPALVHADDDSREEPVVMVQSADMRQEMRFLRCLVQTELTARGPHASNQQSRLEGLMKDGGAKLSLRRPGLALQPIPGLSVLSEPGSRIRTSRRVFNPGELRDHSLQWSDNIIPCHNMEHEIFRNLRGKDFTAIVKDRSVIFKRKIKDLSKEEKNSFMFLKPRQPNVQSNSSANVSEKFRNVLHIQSHEGFLLHIQ